MVTPWHDVALVDSAAWAGWTTLAAWRGRRWSGDRLARDGWLTRLRPWERGGGLYVGLGIRRWKRWVPDAGRLFGGRPRRVVRPRDPAEWEALVAESRRAERVHWLTLAALPVVLVWNRGILLAAMVVYAGVANGPCIAIQRYNRARLGRLLAGAGATGRLPPAPPAAATGAGRRPGPGRR
ncbi:MAG: hypothetical protein ACRDY0_13325 [Acidimicrobiales bacterium]